MLLFAVPASPLAQPYPILAGNALAALVGVTAAWLIPIPIVAALIAVSLATVAMAFFRCIHPPSGAVALMTVLGGPHVSAAGYSYIVVPILLNSVLVIAVVIGWNNLTGRSYPSVAHPVIAPPRPHIDRPALMHYEAMIADYGETLTTDERRLRELRRGPVSFCPSCRN